MRAFGYEEVLGRETVWGDHAHPTHELVWHDAGSGVVKVGRRLWTVAGNVALWIPAGLVHSGCAHAGSRQRTVHFAVDTPALGPGPVAVELTPLLSLLIDRLREGGLNQSSRDLAERMILDVMRPSGCELVLDVPASPVIRPIVETVRSDPADQTTLAVWVIRTGVSTRTITRTFEAETGRGFSRWVAMARVKHAVALMGSGHSLAETADRVGYRSASAFITAFRRVTGVTPGQYAVSESRSPLS